MGISFPLPYPLDQWAYYPAVRAQIPFEPKVDARSRLLLVTAGERIAKAAKR